MRIVPRFAAARRRIPMTLLVLGAMSGPAHASSQIWAPVNPDFGGNPLNASQLLGVANAINKFTAPLNSQPLSQQFVQQLQSRLLSGLADNVVNAIFGPNAQSNGTISFADEVITFSRGLTSVDIDILNTGTGETTHISVPLLSTTPPGPVP